MRLRCFGQSEHARVLLARANGSTFSSPGLSCVCDPFCTYSGQTWELKQRRFWATHVNRKLGLVPFLDTTEFVLLRVFTLIETICPKIWAKPRPKNEKSPLPVDVRLSKMSLLKLEYRRFSWRVHNYIRIFFFHLRYSDSQTFTHTGAKEGSSNISVNDKTHLDT